MRRRCGWIYSQVVEQQLTPMVPYVMKWGSIGEVAEPGWGNFAAIDSLRRYGVGGGGS
jgi:hypothetical protein